MSEEQKELVSEEKNWLSVVLLCIFCAAVIFIGGYSLGIDYGEKRTSIEWAAEFLEGTYAGDESHIGAENPEARRDVAEAARANGKVNGFEVTYVDANGFNLIVTNTDRNGSLYEEHLTLLGGRLRSFSSKPITGD